MPESMPLRAVGWRLLVEPIEAKKQTEGGIALPQEAIDAQEHLRYVGRVVSMGDQAYAKPDLGEKPWCSVGDYVAFGRYAGQEVIVNVEGERKKMKLISDDEVLAVIDDPAAIVTPI